LATILLGELLALGASTSQSGWHAQRRAKGDSYKESRKTRGSSDTTNAHRFPLGLLITSLIFGTIRLGTGDNRWNATAEYMIGAGVLGGLLAAVFGLIDWFGVPRGTRAKGIGLWHGGPNVAWLFFSLSRGPCVCQVPLSPGGGGRDRAVVHWYRNRSCGGLAGWRACGSPRIGGDDGANPDALGSLSRSAISTTPGARRAA
jgi:hypothetical protein